MEYRSGIDANVSRLAIGLQSRLDARFGRPMRRCGVDGAKPIISAYKEHFVDALLASEYRMLPHP